MCAEVRIEEEHPPAIRRRSAVEQGDEEVDHFVVEEGARAQRAPVCQL